eukprot:4924413-Pleurochrysis_carterae.AAC.1
MCTTTEEVVIGFHSCVLSLHVKHKSWILSHPQCNAVIGKGVWYTHLRARSPDAAQTGPIAERLTPSRPLSARALAEAQQTTARGAHARPSATLREGEAGRTATSGGERRTCRARCPRRCSTRADSARAPAARTCGGTRAPENQTTRQHACS